MVTGDNFENLSIVFSISNTSVRRIIKEVLPLIWNCLKKEYVPFPKSTHEWKIIENGFLQIGGIPHTLGALDGKHVRIKKPPHSGSEYFNYKKYFSIVLLALVDASSNFIFVDIGAQGSFNDASVLRNSMIFKKMVTSSLNFPNPEPIDNNTETLPYFFIGDGGFGIHPNLMKPFTGS